MKRLTILILFLSTISVFDVRAQMDPGSLEAYIADHKRMRTLLLARATTEYTNELLHKYVNTQALTHEEISESLDKYKRAFDIIDLLYQSCALILNIYNTVDHVSDRFVDYGKVLSEYYDKIVREGHIEMCDTIILVLGDEAMNQLYEDCKELANSVYDLVLYATGVAECTTPQLLTILESINASLDAIEAHMNRSYLATKKFVLMRVGYYKSDVWNPADKSKEANAALERWREGYKTRLNLN